MGKCEIVLVTHRNVPIVDKFTKITIWTKEELLPETLLFAWLQNLTRQEQAANRPRVPHPRKHEHILVLAAFLKEYLSHLPKQSNY